VRNPLNSANLQLSVLERRLTRQGAAAELHKPVRLVREEIARLSRLLNEFLDFARPHELRVEQLDLRELVAQVIELQQHVAAADGIEIALEAEVPVSILADRAKLTQIVVNLVQNAIEATERGGRVSVQLSRDGAGALIVVRDSGPGIPPEHIDRVFEPFFTTKPTGTGLGMAICYNLVAQHGGDIRVFNDDGAVFEVHLPQKAPA
jgi:signal transduction histidine kinase